MRLASVIFLLFALSACDSQTAYVSEDASKEATAPLEYSAAEEEAPAIDPADTDQQSTTEQESPSQPLTFYENNCTQDCSGHEAGYAWAEENSIEDPSDCGGNSQSFIEGCESYAEEQQSQQEQEEDEEQ